jgi:hypothetical protein
MTTHFDSSIRRTEDHTKMRKKARAMMRRAMAELPDDQILMFNLG